MDHEQFVPANFVHGNEIFDRLLKRLKRLEVFQISDVLTDKSLPVHDQRNGVLQSRRRPGSVASTGRQ